MSNRTWVITGATSNIAKELAHLAALAGHALILVGRDPKQLSVIAADIRLRYRVSCEALIQDFSEDIRPLKAHLERCPDEVDLVIAHSLMINNEKLNSEQIAALIKVNIESTIQLIHTYWHKPQSKHQLLFLSSVAAARGRAKNSLYGASKAAVEVYLQGLQQSASKTQHITIARLGFIDTKLTFGEPGIFYAATPKSCAKACWHALSARKRIFYFPFFWRFIMTIIRCLPFFVYKRMKV